MSESWPSSVLPDPSLEFGGEVEPATIRTRMDSGRTRQRSRFTQSKRIYNASWLLSDLEFGIFQSFLLHKLSNGVDAFEIDLPVGIGSGQLETVEAKLVDGTYQVSHVGVMYHRVSAKLEVESLFVFSEGALDALIAGGTLALPPLSQSFTVALTEGVATQDFVFPVSFAPLGPPPGIKLQLISPVSGFSFSLTVVGTSKTETGFTAEFGANVPGPGYSVSIIASFSSIP